MGHGSLTTQSVEIILICLKSMVLLFHSRLANQLMTATEAAPEPWLAMGYYSLETKKAARALYFAHKVGKLLIYLPQGELL